MSAIPPLAIEQRTFKSRRSGPRSDIAYGSDPGFDFRGCCHAGAPAAENSDRTGPCLPLADSTMRGLAAWTFRPVHEEVFKDETAFAASSGAPQLRQVIWRSTDTAPASVRTILYWAPQLGQSKGVIGALVAMAKRVTHPQCRGKNKSSLWLRTGWLKQGGSLRTSMTEL